MALKLAKGKHSWVVSTQAILIFLGLLLVTLLVANLVSSPGMRVYESFEAKADTPATQTDEPFQKCVVGPVSLPKEVHQGPAIIKAMSQTACNMMNTIRPASQGPPGPPGTRGPSGPAGGTARVFGPLRPLSHTGMVAERLHGTCPGGKVLLNAQSYEPQQTWTMTSGGLLQNNYGQSKHCLTTDDKGNICMTPCPTSPTTAPNTQRWSVDGSGRIRSARLVGGKPMCLTVKEGTITGNTKVGEKSKSINQKYENAQYLTLKSCEDNPTASQRWAFY
jgi:hypothetical protein